MKPPPPFARPRPFPMVEACLQSDLSDWRSSSWPNDDDSDSPARRFHQFNRDFRRQMMRERQREWIFFAVLMLIVAWPVFYTLYGVIRLLFQQHLLGL